MEGNTTYHRYQENEGRQAKEKGGGHQAHHALMISRRWPSKSTPSYHKSRSLLQVKFTPPFPPFFGTSMGDQLSSKSHPRDSTMCDSRTNLAYTFSSVFIMRYFYVNKSRTTFKNIALASLFHFISICEVISYEQQSLFIPLPWYQLNRSNFKLVACHLEYGGIRTIPTTF